MRSLNKGIKATKAIPIYWLMYELVEPAVLTGKILPQSLKDEIALLQPSSC